MGRAGVEGPHFFVGADDHDGSAGVVRGDQAHHLVRVLRVRPGDPLSVADGTGSVYQARVRSAQLDLVAYRVVDRIDVPAPRPSLTVVHALPKGRKLDEVVQRLTEIGVDRIVPVHSARTQVRLEGARAERARARWEAVALAAAKQSRRARLPEIAEIGDWDTAFFTQMRGVVLHAEATERLRARVDATLDALVLAVGPEGGLTDEEIAACGLLPASLGPTILRTETAALVACAAVLTLTGRLG